MIKTLNMLASGNDVPIADERKKFSRMMLIEEIEEHPDFKILYNINPELLERIVSSMKESGFDDSQPVHIWLTEDNHSYLIDGYTRYTASKKAGITSIPVFEHRFKSFDETYKYVLSLQVNRRNLDPDELIKNIAVLSKCDFVKESQGYKAELIANSLGISKRTAERAISIEKNADEELKGRIERKEVTLNQAYDIIHDSSKKQKLHEKMKKIVSRVAYYVVAEMNAGFTAENLLCDEDFKDALENPEMFEIPEADVQVLVDFGIDEKLLRGKN